MKFLIAQLFPSSCYILVNPRVLFKQNETFILASAQLQLHFVRDFPGLFQV